MKNKMMHRILCTGLALVMTLSLSACAQSQSPNDSKAPAPGKVAELLDMDKRPDAPANIPSGLEIDWNHRYTFKELEDQLKNIAEAYPDITELTSIGSSWEERELWCMKLTNEATPEDAKTPLAIVANIHGGERESASSAMYTIWWMALCSDDPYVKGLLDHYILYVIPVMNPDGYEQSFINNNRPNMHPTDRNNDGRPFSDPYTDINGDGFISTIYRGKATDTPSFDLAAFGMESSDWDKNGVLGDDPHSSSIDMNRTFNYMFNRCDIDKGIPIGNNAWGSTGKGMYMPAVEPEVEAIQRFFYANPVYAMITVHTGIQCVLYPWCYRPYDANEEIDADIPFMKETAAKMAEVFQNRTGRGFYTGSSYEDYPTSAEMIDWTYGRLGIHSYTVEVYSGGKSENGKIEDCLWENELPEPTWTFYSKEDIKNVLKLDPAALTDSDGKPLAADEGLWFYTSSADQMVNRAPDEQDIMVKGFLDCALTMIHSEPNGDGPVVPNYYK